MKGILRRTTRQNCRTTRQNCRTIKKKGRTTRQNCRTTRQNCRTTRHPRKTTRHPRKTIKKKGRTTRQNCRTTKKNVSKISKGGGGSVVTGIKVDDEPLFGKATFTKDPNDSKKKKVIYKKTITLEQFKGMNDDEKYKLFNKLELSPQNINETTGESLIRSIIFGLQNCCFDFINNEGKPIDIDDLINKLLNKICWSYFKSNTKYKPADNLKEGLGQTGHHKVEPPPDGYKQKYDDHKNKMLTTKIDYLNQGGDCIDYDEYEKKKNIHREVCNTRKVESCIRRIKISGSPFEIREIVKLLGINIVVVKHENHDEYFLKLENNENTPVIFIYLDSGSEMFEGMYLEDDGSVSPPGPPGPPAANTTAARAPANTHVSVIPAPAPAAASGSNEKIIPETAVSAQPPAVEISGFPDNYKIFNGIYEPNKVDKSTNKYVYKKKGGVVVGRTPSIYLQYYDKLFINTNEAKLLFEEIPPSWVLNFEAEEDKKSTQMNEAIIVCDSEKPQDCNIRKVYTKIHNTVHIYELLDETKTNKIKITSVGTHSHSSSAASEKNGSPVTMSSLSRTPDNSPTTSKSSTLGPISSLTDSHPVSLRSSYKSSSSSSSSSSPSSSTDNTEVERQRLVQMETERLEAERLQAEAERHRLAQLEADRVAAAKEARQKVEKVENVEKFQSNCQRVEEICNLGVSNLNDINIEARQHINDDSYEELQTYINGEYSKAQKDILQTINTDLEKQLEECSVNFLIDPRLKNIYTQISRDMKKTRDESKKIVELAHIHSLFIRDEQDETGYINAKFVPYDITGTNVTYINRNNKNIFLKRQNPGGNWQVVVYDQGPQKEGNVYLEFVCQDIHPDNCKDNGDISLQVYKKVGSNMQQYTGVTIKLFSEHLKDKEKEVNEVASAAKKAEEFQNNCQRVAKICNDKVKELNSLNIEARQHINDDSYEELQTYINGEYSKEQEDILQTIQHNLGQLKNCSDNILIDPRLKEIYTQLLVLIDETREESKKIVQLAHIHPLFIKDEKDKSGNINAKFVPYDITGTKVTYIHGDKGNIFLERQNPGGNWQVVIYEGRGGLGNVYLKFVCQDIHPDNCNDIRLKVYKKVGSNMQQYTGVTIKLFSEHLKEIREAKTKCKEVINDVTDLMNRLKDLNHEANTEFENLKKDEDKSYFLIPLFTFFIKESKYIEKFKSLLDELYKNYEQLMNCEDEEVYYEPLLSEILSTKTTIEEKYDEFNGKLATTNINYEYIKMLKEYFDLYSKLVKNESHDFLGDIKVLVQTYNSIEKKLFLNEQIKTREKNKIIDIQQRYCNNLKTQINHLVDTQIKKLREITDLLKQVTLNRNSKLYTPSQEQLTKVELIKHTYNEYKTKFEGLFNEYILCTSSNNDFLPFGEEITKKEAYNMKLFEDIENTNTQLYFNKRCFYILDMTTKIYTDIQNNSRDKDREDALLSESAHFLSIIEKSNITQMYNDIVIKTKNNIRITIQKIVEEITTELKSIIESTSELPTKLFEKIHEQFDKLIPVYNFLSKSLSQEEKEQFKQLQSIYCNSLKGKIRENIEKIVQKVRGIGEKSLEQIDGIKNNVDTTIDVISELFILFSRCHGGNTDKNSKFLFNDEEYYDYKSFLHEIQTGFYKIHKRIEEAISEKQEEEEGEEIQKLKEMEKITQRMKEENEKMLEEFKRLDEISQMQNEDRINRKLPP